MTMNSNDVLRRLRYTFDFNDAKIVEIFALAQQTVSREQVSAWLKHEAEPSFQRCKDVNLASFLNGLIVEKRGAKDGPQPVPEQHLTNNIIFRKLKIALQLEADAVLELLKLAGMTLSKHELSAFFRNPSHKHFRECQDQILRNFLLGLQLQHRGAIEDAVTTK